MPREAALRTCRASRRRLRRRGAAFSRAASGPTSPLYFEPTVSPTPSQHASHEKRLRPHHRHRQRGWRPAALAAMADTETASPPPSTPPTSPRRADLGGAPRRQRLRQLLRPCQSTPPVDWPQDSGMGSTLVHAGHQAFLQPRPAHSSRLTSAAAAPVPPERRVAGACP